MITITKNFINCDKCSFKIEDIFKIFFIIEEPEGCGYPKLSWDLRRIIIEKPKYYIYCFNCFNNPSKKELKQYYKKIKENNLKLLKEKLNFSLKEIKLIDDLNFYKKDDENYEDFFNEDTRKDFLNCYIFDNNEKKTFSKIIKIIDFSFLTMIHILKLNNNFFLLFRFEKDWFIFFKVNFKIVDSFKELIEKKKPIKEKIEFLCFFENDLEYLFNLPILNRLQHYEYNFKNGNVFYSNKNLYSEIRKNYFPRGDIENEI